MTLRGGVLNRNVQIQAYKRLQAFLQRDATYFFNMNGEVFFPRIGALGIYLRIADKLGVSAFGIVKQCSLLNEP